MKLRCLYEGTSPWSEDTIIWVNPEGKEYRFEDMEHEDWAIKITGKTSDQLIKEKWMKMRIYGRAKTQAYGVASSPIYLRKFLRIARDHGKNEATFNIKKSSGEETPYKWAFADGEWRDESGKTEEDSSIQEAKKQRTIFLENKNQIKMS